MGHNYEGAGWVQRQLNADNERISRNKLKNRVPKPLKTMSVLGRQVADLLGFVYRGIYHTNIDNTDWGNDEYITATVFQPLSTFDDRKLTELVVLCHAKKLRMQITAGGPHRLKLTFSPRKERKGDIAESHPTLEAAVEHIRSQYDFEVLP